jgi:hypothetical protein
MTHVTNIEFAVRDREWVLASRLATDTAQYVKTVHGWLGNRFETAADNTMSLASSSSPTRGDDPSARRGRISRKRGDRRL